jgi:hypothetical protein
MFGGGDAEAVFAQVTLQKLADAAVVIDDEDMRRIVGDGRASRLHCASLVCGQYAVSFALCLRR